MDNSKSYFTPMSTSTKLDKDEGGKYVDSKLYRSMISSLFYLIASRPDIMFAHLFISFVIIDNMSNYPHQCKILI